MKNVVHTVIATSAALLFAAALPAQAATKAEVAKARAECAQNKAKVRSMENKGSGDLASAKKEWEASCQRAEVLINEADGTPPPAVVTPGS
jgi:hypothetical protein